MESTLNDFFEKIELLNISLKKFELVKDKNITLNIEQNNQLQLFNKQIDKLIDKINEITYDIDNIQNLLDKNEVEKNDVIEKRIEQHDKFMNLYNQFMPLMILYNVFNKEEL